MEDEASLQKAVEYLASAQASRLPPAPALWGAPPHAAVIEMPFYFLGSSPGHKVLRLPRMIRGANHSASLRMTMNFGLRLMCLYQGMAFSHAVGDV